MEIANRIIVDEKIRFGKPVIKGSRVPVDLIIGKLAGGMTYDEVMSEYELTKEDILYIRRKYRSRTDLAKQFNMTRANISKIQLYKTWK